ncbi:hypothetical protein EDB85DRAFT_2293101, partial [Lactarius pseudohatsudake]
MLRQLGKRLADIRGLLDRLDASMASVNERVTPESSRTVPSYRVAPVPIRHPKSRSANGPTPCTTLTRHVGCSHHRGCGGFRSGSCSRRRPAQGSADEPGTFLPPDRTLSTTG